MADSLEAVHAQSMARRQGFLEKTLGDDSLSRTALAVAELNQRRKERGLDEEPFDAETSAALARVFADATAPGEKKPLSEHDLARILQNKKIIRSGLMATILTKVYGDTEKREAADLKKRATLLAGNLSLAPDDDLEGLLTTADPEEFGALPENVRSNLRERVNARNARKGLAVLNDALKAAGYGPFPGGLSKAVEGGFDFAPVLDSLPPGQAKELRTMLWNAATAHEKDQETDMRRMNENAIRVILAAGFLPDLTEDGYVQADPASPVGYKVKGPTTTGKNAEENRRRKADAAVARGMYERGISPKFDEDGFIVRDENGEPVVEGPTLSAKRFDALERERAQARARSAAIDARAIEGADRNSLHEFRLALEKTMNLHRVPVVDLTGNPTAQTDLEASMQDPVFKDAYDKTQAVLKRLAAIAEPGAAGGDPAKKIDDDLKARYKAGEFGTGDAAKQKVAEERRRLRKEAGLPEK